MKRLSYLSCALAVATSFPAWAADAAPASIPAVSSSVTRPQAQPVDNLSTAVPLRPQSAPQAAEPAKSVPAYAPQILPAQNAGTAVKTPEAPAAATIAAPKVSAADAKAPGEALPPNAKGPADGANLSYPVDANPVVTMTPGKNVFIPVATGYLNRLITPFTDPAVATTNLRIGTASDCAQLCVRGSVIYLSPEGTEPETLFITQRGQEEVALSVTLLPRRIPPREVRLQLPGEVAEALKQSQASTSEAASWETSAPYVSTLKDAFKKVALGQVPPGYTLRAPKAGEALPRCSQQGLVFDFARGQVLEGYRMSFYVGIARSVAAGPVELLAQSCGAQNVAAAASWPHTLLNPGERTEMYVAVKKINEPAPTTVRPALVR